MTIKNLWGDTLVNAMAAKDPYDFLKEQAEALPGATGGKLVAEVDYEMQNRIFLAHLKVGVPEETVETQLVSLTYEPGRYPVSVLNTTTDERKIAKNQDEFLSLLGECLAGDETRQILQSLMLQDRVMPAA